MTHARNISSPLVFSYDGIGPDRELLRWIEDRRVGGVVIFRENAVDERALSVAIRALRDAGGPTLRIMIDEEGGQVRRLPDAPTSMRDLRDYEAEDVRVVADAYANVARRLDGFGIDTLLAPVVDVGNHHAEWLRRRTYSDSAPQVALMASAVIPAIQRVGVAACAKHFPGTRTVAQDTHRNEAIGDASIPDWERIDAIPFRAAIQAGVATVMVGHQRMQSLDAARPACLSPIIVRALLRERLGFNGLVLTDDMAMGAMTQRYSMDMAVPAASAAGCDYLLVCRNRLLQRQALFAYEEHLADATTSQSTS